jgi:hypothetical protein
VIAHYRALDPGKKFYFEFTGGEVSLYRDFLKLAGHLQSRGCRVGMISNASRSMEWWQNVPGKIDHICLSFHPESCKKEHFLKVAGFLRERLRVHVNIMMLPERFDECCEFAERVCGLGDVGLGLQPLLVGLRTELYRYAPGQLIKIEKLQRLLTGKMRHSRKFDIFRGDMIMRSPRRGSKPASPQTFIVRGTNSWKGWKCSAGLEQIVVNMNGWIYRGWCLEGGAIGNIRDERITFPVDSVLCAKSACHCNFDIMCSKTKVQ